ncbi:MAG: hypothetical protein ACE5J9_00295 [Methanosarcinales archaeon]
MKYELLDLFQRLNSETWKSTKVFINSELLKQEEIDELVNKIVVDNGRTTL